MSRTCIVALALGSFVAAASAPGQQLQYTVWSIGSPSSPGSQMRLNNSRQIIGGYDVNWYPSQQFWSPQGGFTRLDLGNNVLPIGLNDNGVICGRTFSPQVGGVVTPGQPIATISGTTAAYDINAAGDVVCVGNIVDQFPDAAPVYVVMHDNTVRTLSGAGLGIVQELPAAINDRGEVATADWYVSSGRFRLIFWSADGAIHIRRASPAGGLCKTTDISNHSEIVGTLSTTISPPWDELAFRWHPPLDPVSLGVLPEFTRSKALAINESGVIVGQCAPPLNPNGPSHWGGWEPTGSAFLWTPATGMLDLDTLVIPVGAFWHIVAATDINDHGDIVAAAQQGSGPLEIVLLEPVRMGRADIAGSFGVALPDGQLTADDVIAFLSAFFGDDNPIIADLAGPGGTPQPDGQLTADDVIVFLASFFSGQ